MTRVVFEDVSMAVITTDDMAVEIQHDCMPVPGGDGTGMQVATLRLTPDEALVFGHALVTAARRCAPHP